MLKLEKEKELAKLTKEEEISYRKDFWKTAKNVTNGTFGKQMSGPTFEKTTADQHYKDKYEKPVNIDVNKLNWFQEVNPPTIKYNLSPYTPKDIKHALYKKCSNSAPGED